MTGENRSARPWKVASGVLAVACLGLGTVVLLGWLDPPAMQVAGNVAATRSAPVKLRAVNGDPELAPALRKGLEARLKSGVQLSHSEPGVEQLSVDANVTATTAEKDALVEIEVKVALLLAEQPGERLYGSYSCHARVGIDKSAGEAELAEARAAAVDAAAARVFEDLKEAVAEP